MKLSSIIVISTLLLAGHQSPSKAADEGRSSWSNDTESNRSAEPRSTWTTGDDSSRFGSTRSSWSEETHVNRPRNDNPFQVYAGLGYGKVYHELDFFEYPTNYELLLGFRNNDTLAIEISYLDLGKAGDNISPEWTLTNSGYTLGLVGSYRANTALKLETKLGILSWKQKISEQGSGTIYTDDGNDFFLGVGGIYLINEVLGIGLRYNLYQIDDFYSNGDEGYNTLQMQLLYTIK